MDGVEKVTGAALYAADYYLPGLLYGKILRSEHAHARIVQIDPSKALALEGAKLGITVNAVAPGYVDTDMVRAVPETVLEKIVAGIPVGRLGRVADIARAVLFLVADEADFITGSTLSVNGGQHMY